MSFHPRGGGEGPELMRERRRERREGYTGISHVSLPSGDPDIMPIFGIDPGNAQGSPGMNKPTPLLCSQDED